MKDSKLLATLHKLDKKELSSLKKWLQSPFANQREDVRNLYSYLLSAMKAKRKGVFKRAVIYDAIYPKEVFNDKKLKHLQSYLFAAVKSFLSYQEWQADGEQPNIYLCRALRKRGLIRSFETSWKETDKRTDQQPLRHAVYHWQKSQLHREWFEYSASLSRIGIDSLQEYFNELNHFFVALKMEQACAGLTYENLQNVEFDYSLLSEVLHFMENNQNEALPSIALYLNTYKAFKNHNNEGEFYFEEMRRVMRESGHCFPKSELRNAYLLASNYCIKQANNNRPMYLPIMFELYKEGLEKGVFNEKGIMSRFTFTNIVKTAIANQQFSWAVEFIDHYKNELKPTYQENIPIYNRLLLCHRQAKYEEAIQLYADLQLDDLFYNIDAKRILIKIYFELQEWDALNSLLDSFYTFLYRQKGLKYHKSNYLNLIRFVRKMMQLPAYDKEKKDLLVNTIKNTKSIVEKQWLLEQLGK